MSTMIQILFTLTVVGSSIVACLLVLRLLLPNAVSIKWYYRIGKMAIIFYLLPIAFLIQWISSLLTLDVATSVQGSGEWHSSVPYVSLKQSEPFSISANITFLILSIWGIGVIVFAGWQVYCYRKFLKIIHQTYMPLSENSEVAKKLALMKEVLGIKRNVRIAYSEAVRSPFLMGLWKPTIYIPKGNNADLDMCMVIHHELIHIKRKDLWIKALVLGANALHWFNPLVYVLRRDIHIWSELSCDEEVVREMPYAERKRYGETILNVMIGSRELPVRFCSSLSGNGKQLKRRLNTMLNVKKLNKRTMIISIMAMIIIGIIGTSTAVWASEKSPEVDKEIGETDVEYPEKQEENVADDQVNRKVTEMEKISAEEATDKHIQRYQEKLGDVGLDPEFWAEVEEDTGITVLKPKTTEVAVEVEEAIFVEVDNK